VVRAWKSICDGRMPLQIMFVAGHVECAGFEKERCCNTFVIIELSFGRAKLGKTYVQFDVTAGDNLWEEGAYTWGGSRVFEYTDEDLKSELRDFSHATLETLIEIPTHFLYEDGAEDAPRIGPILQIDKRKGDLRISYEFDERFSSLTAAAIRSNKWELQIENFEFTRTHWAVERADLLKVMQHTKGPLLETFGDAIDKFKEDATLQEIIEAIHHEIRAENHSLCLDRLHTYCMKKFAHLLQTHGVTCGREEPLHSRVGKYIKELEKARTIQEASKRILRSSISVFEQFNQIRNNFSPAHDNELLERAEAGSYAIQ